MKKKNFIRTSKKQAGEDSKLMKEKNLSKAALSAAASSLVNRKAVIVLKKPIKKTKPKNSK